ncbi:MAG: chromate transporter [Bacteroidales bacterium]|nr:chromate transporter [Bacteroidales bacterium]
MIFAELFFTFLKIGLFTFGGGYSMVALIEDEVVTRHAWLSAQEFVDILAVSQMTPGPIGINTATYAGYAAVVGAGLPQWQGVLGALIASLAVIMLPVALILVVSTLLNRYRKSAAVESMFSLLRIAVVGLIAAAALSLVSTDTFGEAGLNLRFVLSIVIAAVVFVLTIRRKASPVLLILAAGAVGLVVYSVFPQ